MNDVTIRGADQLAALSRRIKEIGNRGLRLELLRSIQRAGQPLTVAGQEAILENLPRRAGVNRAVAARTKVGLRTRTSGRTPGVRVLARSGSHIAAMNRGVLRHPVYGDENHWVAQAIDAGWWEARLMREAPMVRAQVIAGMNRVAERAAHYG